MSEMPGNLQCVPSTRTEFGKRSFRVAAPRTWNSLPLHLRSPTISRQQFQSGLKTHLFKRAYIWLLPPRTIEEWTYLLTYLLTYLHQLSYSRLHQHQESAVHTELSCQGGTEQLLTPSSWWSFIWIQSLPVQSRVSFMVAHLDYKILSTGQPIYIWALLHHYTPHYTLQSLNQQFLEQLRVSSEFGMIL